MVKVGFSCMRSALCALNVVYMMVGILLIGVAAWKKGFALVASSNIVSGVVALAVILLLISMLGLVGTVRHHQILLFFYMVILLVVFLFQFGVSCSCLAFSTEQQCSDPTVQQYSIILIMCLYQRCERVLFQENVLHSSWGTMDSDARKNLEQHMDCCGLIDSPEKREEFSMDASLCTAACKVKGICFKCGDLLLEDGGEALKILGGVGLFFSFSELLGVWLVLRYRNQKDPQTGPDAF
ncbi:tetraspanin-31-B-like isoform X1 [Colossoma macropomum]|uniref:tetraspanin-31-B-like isoform X1 n=1 Tax=Colossoma macropomum TaxID=42526 RepID=UPI00186470E6|nr:tetraspanin-31-B-like isoform X1 [Colossoma macropomum]